MLLQRQSVYLLLMVDSNSSLSKVFSLKKEDLQTCIVLLLALSN